MKVEESFVVACSIEDMYRDLNDVDGIGRCVAGVQEVTTVNETDSIWKVEFRAGFMARTMTLDAKITERRPVDFIAFTAKGQDLDINGHMALESKSPVETACSVVLDAAIGGPLGPIVDLMAKGPQQQLIDETITNIRRRAEGEPELEPPPRRVGPIRAFFRRLFGRSTDR